MRKSELIILLTSIGNSTREKIEKEIQGLAILIRWTALFIAVFLIAIVGIFVYNLQFMKKTIEYHTEIIEKTKIIYRKKYVNFDTNENLIKVAKKGKQNCRYYSLHKRNESFYYTVCRDIK